MSMITAQVGARIRKIKIEKTGISQEKFANEIGMDRTYFSGVECGKRNLSLNSLDKIIKGLGISYSDFFAKGWDEEDPINSRKEKTE